MKVVLAEKPSVARDIAKCLKATHRQDGYLEGNGWAVTWAFGHLVELQEPNEYNPQWKRWSLDSLPMIPEEFHLRARGDQGAQKQLGIIKGLFDQAEELVCATDAGREGELIFRYIQSWAGSTEKPFKRLWISSLTDEAIRKGFAGLRDGHTFDPLYQAARCRSEADWIVGLNGTRFFTVKYGRDKELWSVGRVQTPVLAMIVNRDLEIENFQPQDYWELHTRYRKTVFKHTGGKIEKQEEADAKLENVTGHDLEITGIKEQKKNFNPPLLYDLTELQRDMNKRWGLTADQTLKAAQSLYERKHITYPRTDSRYLSSDMKGQMPKLLNALRPLQPEAIAGLDLANLSVGSRIVNDAKVSDHHAIIPTDQLPRNVGGNEGKVYEAVLMRFIAAFYPVCVKSVTTVNAISNGESFRASGTVIVDPGWQVLFPKMLEQKKKKPKKKPDEDAEEEEEEEDQVLPVFEKGERGPHEPFIKTLKTKPPKAFNEASLLQLMETAGKTVEDEALKEALKEKGIGTPATRASIIEVLLHRKYILRRKKNLLSTPAGRDLIRIIQDERLKSPELTGEWEALLKQIEQNKYDPQQFMEQVIEHTRKIISQSGAVKRGPKQLGSCPLCDGQIIEGKKGYGCSRWKAGCKFVLWKEQFGYNISPPQMMELLSKRKVTEPAMLVDGEKRFYGKLVLNAANEIAYERVGARTKVRDRAIMGLCPLCGSDIIESEKAYGCANWKSGCKFVIWKTMAHRKLPKDMVRVLLKDGITPFIQKFKKRDGKRFDARLKLVNGEVQFDFTPTEKKNKGEVEDESGGAGEQKAEG